MFAGALIVPITRIPCTVAECGRGIGIDAWRRRFGDIDEETAQYVCQRHWTQVPKAMRMVHSRARRRDRRMGTHRPATARIWRRIIAMVAEESRSAKRTTEKGRSGMSQRVRSSAKWANTFKALSLANEAIGGPEAKQFLIPDSDDPRDVERSFSPGADADDRRKAREFLDYCFVGEGFDLTVDRGHAYYEGRRERLSTEEVARRRDRLEETHAELGIVE